MLLSLLSFVLVVLAAGFGFTFGFGSAFLVVLGALDEIVFWAAAAKDAVRFVIVVVVVRQCLLLKTNAKCEVINDANFIWFSYY